MVRSVNVITTAISTMEMVGLGASIELPPMRNHGALLAYERFAFYMCFEQIIQNALRITKYHLKSPNDEVQFIFDKQPGYHGTGYEQFEKACFNLQVGLRHRLPPPIFGDSAEVLPLQAADLLAHETFKEVKNHQDGRNLSAALRALVTGRQHHGDFVDARAFAAIEKASRAKTTHLIPAEDLRGVRRLYDSHQPLRGDELSGKERKRVQFA